MSGCGNCGAEITHAFDERGERWRHLVEPIGHEAIPNDAVAFGRARAVEDLRRQMEFEVGRGTNIDLEWLRSYLRYHGKPELVPTVEQENAAYREAMEALRTDRPS
jgi:hypothetical protein